jgi:glycosyltransferase involved in cell wall biosynthesis
MSLVVAKPGVSVIIPARNEEKNLPLILDSLPGSIDEVIVIDGNSTDDTVAVAEAHPRVSRVVVQRSKGKGAALSLGLRVASHDYVVMIDADGSMDTQEIPAFVAALEAGADVVRGSRYLPAGGSEDLTPFRSFGNRVLTGLANVLFDVKWTDLAYGYAAFRKSALEQMDVFYYDSKIGSLPFSRGMSYGQGFEIESLIFCRSARRGLMVVEIPSVEASRWHGASNLKAIPDGFRALSAILVERARSRRIRLED